jgi:DNA/RNA-binding domain of Phe-tRNA-synthetase-like protein
MQRNWSCNTPRAEEKRNAQIHRASQAAGPSMKNVIAAVVEAIRTSAAARWLRVLRLRYDIRSARVMLTFSIDRPLFEWFPQLRVGAFMASDLGRIGPALLHDGLDTAWAAAATELARRGITPDNVDTVPPIQAWRRTFEACGVMPSVYTGSVEAVVRRTLAYGREFTRVPVASLCAAVSAHHLAPLRGFDVDTLPSSSLTLRTARPQTDFFLPLDARPTDIPLDPHVVVYAAGRIVLCWSFNHRDSRQTCLADDTMRAVFFSEAIDDEQAATASAALNHLRRILIQHSVHVGPLVVADAYTPSIGLRFKDECRPS